MMFGTLLCRIRLHRYGPPEVATEVDDDGRIAKRVVMVRRCSRPFCEAYRRVAQRAWLGPVPGMTRAEIRRMRRGAR